ncbi:NAD(P)/FAD-dependent oxidoreductase [Cohnella pontilimi]|uniref:NAD(P)/FAD-dependent oxidoreductase n=1 Tax=Cohnella pontilimi TaxID=2564100 RepID=A0A4U0FHV8_9BACL|nr:NAD(P)/FAD-dependent oxidoreductase [Cohnella pontilimi]TJY44034.1 NAD(P)/FAD-dependent oxidoreductase [Cohnella pontilimi]
MLHDCAIIGGGPAGLNAALVLGRSRRNVVLFDNNRARNAVTQEAHGFMTRDGIPPAELRAIAHRELTRYPSVQFRQVTVTEVAKASENFRIRTENGDLYEARTVLLASGLKETLPDIPDIHTFYGKSLFNCPYCDGWERKDEPLVVIAENEHAFDLAKTTYQWSRSLLLCTNGHAVLTAEQKEKLASKNIRVNETRIRSLKGHEGKLQSVVFEGGEEEARTGGFVSPHWTQAAPFGEHLGCRFNEHGGIESDDFGRTNVENVFSAGDASVIIPAQLVVAAGEGSRAGIGINSLLTTVDF